MTRELIELAERLEDHASHQVGDAFRNCREAAAMLRELAAQRPVAWLVYDGEGFNPGPVKMSDADLALYGAPVPAITAEQMTEREQIAADYDKANAERYVEFDDFLLGWQAARAAPALSAEQKAEVLRLLREANWLLGHAVSRDTVDEWQRRKFALLDALSDYLDRIGGQHD
jgi:hypothetical protein